MIHLFVTTNYHTGSVAKVRSSYAEVRNKIYEMCKTCETYKAYGLCEVYEIQEVHNNKLDK